MGPSMRVQHCIWCTVSGVCRQEGRSTPLRSGHAGGAMHSRCAASASHDGHKPFPGHPLRANNASHQGGGSNSFQYAQSGRFKSPL